MSQDKEIRVAVIGTVVGGLILTGILWALGAVRAVATFLWQVVKSIGEALVGEIGLPAWLVVLTMGFLTWILVRGFLLWRRGRGNRVSDVMELPERDRTLLIGIRLGDGDRVELAELAKFAKVSRLEVEAGMERLEMAGLVQPHYNAFSGTSWTLTTEGRDLLPDLQAVVAAKSG